ncbi:hypothetical protein P7K49_023494, partial [Saguinus oedipus]
LFHWKTLTPKIQLTPDRGMPRCTTSPLELEAAAPAVLWAVPTVPGDASAKRHQASAAAMPHIRAALL